MIRAREQSSPRMTVLRESAAIHQPRRKPVTAWSLKRARAEELDTIRLTRPLTDAEHAEADRLAAQLYARVRRAQLAERFGGKR